MKFININVVSVDDINKTVLSLTKEGVAELKKIIENKAMSPLQHLQYITQELDGETIENIEGKIVLCNYKNIAYEGRNVLYLAKKTIGNEEIIINSLLEKKGAVTFVPHDDFKWMDKEARIKINVDSFGTYCPQTIEKVASESNRRYSTLATIVEPIFTAIEKIKASAVVSADTTRVNKLSEVADDISKEMDVLIEKMNFLNIISDKNLYSEEPVNAAYKKFKGIENEQINVEVQEE